MGLRLDKEADSLRANPRKAAAPAPIGPAEPAKVIRSRWMG
jgi:hypothetical protein